MTKLISSYLDQARSICEQEKPNDIFATWYDVAGKASTEYTFGRLWQEAGVISYYLREKWGLQKGDRVVLCYDFGLHFLAVFLGCLRAGVVAVLVYPPAPPLAKSLPKLSMVVEACTPQLILTDSKIMTLKKLDEANPFSKSRSLWPTKIQFKVTDTLPVQPSKGAKRGGLFKGWLASSSESSTALVFDEPNIAPDDLAFLQFTSGSTSVPKGVMVTHKNLAANANMYLSGMIDASKVRGVNSTRETATCWLPQYHDMGLLCGNLYPFVGGWRMHMMSPLTFIKNPLLWFQIMGQTKTTMTIAPDFSYRLVVRKFTEQKQRFPDRDPIPNLDLSSLWNVMNCAEPIRLDTRRMLLDSFASNGLRDDCFTGAYGLAENVVCLTYANKYRVSDPRNNEDMSSYVASGCRETMKGYDVIKIVDPQTRMEVPDDATGELWVSGPSVTAGYYGRPDLTEDAFNCQLVLPSTTTDNNEEQSQFDERKFMRTGDLGFYQNDHLYICGRIKDIVIVNGVNYYPQDIEFVTQDASQGVRPGCVAAFSSDDSGGDGNLEVVFELRPNHNAQEACQAVKNAIALKIGLLPSCVVAIQDRCICKTTSGKIQRRATRTKLHNNELPVVYRLDHDSSSSEPSSKTTATTTTVAVDEEAPALSDSERYDRVVMDVFGPNVDGNLSWDDNGLTSIMMVEISNRIANDFPVSIPPNFADVYPTPNQLKDYVLQSAQGFFPIELPQLSTSSSSSFLDRPISWALATALQIVGILLLLAVVGISTLPAYYYATTIGGEFRLLLPLMIPIWYLSLTFLLIICKWIIVGRYSAKEINVPSVSYLQWWWMDRLLHVWESLIGTFLTDTPFITIIYQLMGAKIASSAAIKSFLREFDLCSMGQQTTIEHPVRCRKFGPWREDNNSPTLRFRPIQVGDNCKISGHMEPGVSIGNGSRVEKVSAVPEGSQVPSNTTAIGSPAHGAGSTTTTPPNANANWLQLGCIKTVLLFVQLYISASLFVIASMLIPASGLFQSGWRYESACRIFLMVILQIVLSMVSTIVVKWTLIGKRRPGPASSSWAREAIDWFADFNYRVSITIFDSFCANASTVNPFLMLMGLDIDWASVVKPNLFRPSQMDLITLRDSFMSVGGFCTKHEGEYHAITIINGSLGHSAFVAGPATVQNETILPLTLVPMGYKSTAAAATESKDTTTTGSSSSSSSASSSSSSSGWWLRLWADVCIAATILLFFLSLLPTVEIWSLLNDHLEAPSAVIFCIQVAVAIIVQSTTMYICLVLIQTLFFPTTRGTLGSKDLSIGFLAAYWPYVYTCWVWSFLHLLWGTPFFAYVLKGLGTKVEGQLLFFGGSLYDFALLAFGDKTIVDGGLIFGHFVQKGKFVIGRTRVVGLLHPRTQALGNTLMMGDATTTTQVGPMRFLSPAVSSSEKSSSSLKEVDDDGPAEETRDDCSLSSADLNTQDDKDDDHKLDIWV